MGSELQQKLPVLDFSSDNLKPGTSTWLSTSKEVMQALEDYGCFVVVYDKAPLELRNEVFGALEELFDLPTETKMKNKYDQKPLNGYVGQIPKIPLHESMGIDNATTIEGTQIFTNMLWPNGNNRFCARMHWYAKLAAELDQMVARMIHESFGVEKYYESYKESITYLLQVLKNRAPEENEPALGCVAQTDKSFTTVLHQNHINGLEVETKDGEWITVEYSSPSSFVVMAGDALMAWSNDRIQSPSHRVIMSGNEDRYSLGLFSFSSGFLQVPEELVDDEHPLKYKPFDHIGLLRFFKEDDNKSKCLIKAYCGV